MAPGWLHSGLDREAAEALLLATSGDDGTFLVRKNGKKFVLVRRLAPAAARQPAPPP